MVVHKLLFCVEYKGMVSPRIQELYAPESLYKLIGHPKLLRYSRRIAAKDALLLCTTAFAAGLLGLVPCLVYLKLRGGPVVLDAVRKLTQFNFSKVIGVTVLGCLAQISTYFLYSTTSVHAVQFLRCASPIFAAVAAVSTQEDTMSLGTICSLGSVIIGMGLAAWKVT